jgi:hypothetical protein
MASSRILQTMAEHLDWTQERIPGESQVPVNDSIDIGAFAKPGKGKKYGDTFYGERLHVPRRIKF